MAMGCRQCLLLSVVQLKGKHCRKPDCPNGVVDTFGHVLFSWGMSFNFSWLARTHYLRPIRDDEDEHFEFFFRCNSTIANEGTLYSVYCIPALDLIIPSSSLITRREDATMQCPKTIQKPPYAGVSQNYDISYN